MEDVSDPPFRYVCKKHGADLMYTEFISSEGLIRDAIKSRQKLDIFDYEKPIGIQIFGGDEEAMAMSAKIVDATQPDLLDINFGCPVKKVVCKGAGAGVLKDVELMVRLTKAVIRSTNLPVTIKTRLGWDESMINIMEVAERMQDIGVQAITVHGRTRAQMYKGKSNWNYIADVKNNPRINIPIFGNGDVDSPETALENKNKYRDDKNFRSHLSTPNENSSSRSMSMNEAFGTFDKLENLLSASPGKNKKILPLHPQDLEKLNQFRKNKKMLLEKVGN